MKKFFPAFFGITAFLFALFVTEGVSSRVMAKGDSDRELILVVNIAELISQSKAGRTIPEQAESVRAGIAKELEAEARKLSDDIENFQKNSSLMSEEVRQQTQQELAMRQQVELPRQAQIMEQAFSAAVQNAQSEILGKSEPILKDIVEKRGAALLINKSNVIYSMPEIDITQEAIARLDRKLSEVKVSRVSLAEIEKMIREASETTETE